MATGSHGSPQASPTIQEDELSMGDATIFECSGRGWDADTMFDPGYIGPKWAADSDEFIGGACAQMNDANYNPNDGKCDGAYAKDCPPRTSQPSPPSATKSAASRRTAGSLTTAITR